MAAVALNKFVTIRHKATSNPTGIYTCPPGVYGIVTLCNATNISEGESAGTYSITGIHSSSRRASGQTGEFKFAFNEDIPVNDSMNLIPDGRLSLDRGDTLIFSSNSEEQIDIIVTILETAKQ